VSSGNLKFNISSFNGLGIEGKEFIKLCTFCWYYFNIERKTPTLKFKQFSSKG
jgi:hypothetical protein